LDTPIPGGTERILFVDDEPAIAKVEKAMLESLGYEVTIKTDSFEALKVFQSQSDTFDLIIIDQTMPGMTGFDLAKRILQIRPDIPIILCTGYSSVVNEDVAKSLGIKEFATKPFSKNNISKLIRKVLGDN
jgi:CheY-like chemotaxis protein